MKTKRKLQNLLSFMLCIIMMLTLLPANPIVAHAETVYEIWVAGVRITSDNKDDVLKDGGKVSYDPASNILYLKNATIHNDITSEYAYTRLYGIFSIPVLTRSLILAEQM